MSVFRPAVFRRGVRVAATGLGADGDDDPIVQAARRALTCAGIPAAEVERVIAAPSPLSQPIAPWGSVAGRVQAALELPPGPAFDVGVPGGAFLCGLELASRAIGTGDSCVLIVAGGDPPGATVITPGAIGGGVVGVGQQAADRLLEALELDWDEIDRVVSCAGIRALDEVLRAGVRAGERLLLVTGDDGLSGAALLVADEALLAAVS